MRIPEPASGEQLLGVNPFARRGRAEQEERAPGRSAAAFGEDLGMGTRPGHPSTRCNVAFWQVQRAFAVQGHVSVRGWGGRFLPLFLSYSLSFPFFNNTHFCFHSEVLWGFALPPRQGLNFQFALGWSSKGCCIWLPTSSLEVRGETGSPAACSEGRARPQVVYLHGEVLL